MRYLLIIFIFSCNSDPAVEEPRSRGIERAALGSLSDVVITATPDIIITKSRSGTVLYYKLDVSSTVLGIPQILADIAELKTALASVQTGTGTVDLSAITNELLILKNRIGAIEKDTIYFKGMKGSGTKLIPYEDIEP